MTDIMSTEFLKDPDICNPPRLKRTVEFWGLPFFSLGSIIGSGCLLGALGVAQWHIDMIAAGDGLNTIDYAVAAVLILMFCLINLAVSKLHSGSNTGLVI